MADRKILSQSFTQKRFGIFGILSIFGIFVLGDFGNPFGKRKPALQAIETLEQSLI